jgi:hypothetical protein
MKHLLAGVFLLLALGSRAQDTKPKVNTSEIEKFTLSDLKTAQGTPFLAITAVEAREYWTKHENRIRRERAENLCLFLGYDGIFADDKNKGYETRHANQEKVAELENKKGTVSSKEIKTPASVVLKKSLPTSLVVGMPVMDDTEIFTSVDCFKYKAIQETEKPQFKEAKKH